MKETDSRHGRENGTKNGLAKISAAALGAQTRIQLLVYLRFTCGLLPGSASNTNDGTLVPLDVGLHIFYIWMIFHLYFKDFSFFSIYFQ